jgi:acylphosphatase
MPKHLNITVKGRVQGVGFRRAARDQARYMGIKGFVRNMPNGSVYIEAEGEDDAIALFVRWCRQGPPYGNVEEVNTEVSNWQGFSTFETRF